MSIVVDLEDEVDIRSSSHIDKTRIGTPKCIAGIEKSLPIARGRWNRSQFRCSTGWRRTDKKFF